MQKRANAQDDTSTGTFDGSHTINLLMADSSTAADDRPIMGQAKDQDDDQVPTEDDSSTGELIAPDLVFTAEKEDA